jgi:hypothetical protein
MGEEERRAAPAQTRWIRSSPLHMYRILNFSLLRDSLSLLIIWDFSSLKSWYFPWEEQSGFQLLNIFLCHLNVEAVVTLFFRQNVPLPFLSSNRF